MRTNRLIVLSLAATSLGGCAGLKFYSTPGMEQPEIGLKSYYAKPYILVVRDAAAKTTNANVVYLPDLAHPVYVKPQSGYGSANLSMTFNNGMIASFGQQTDTKIPETLTAFGGLESALATAAKTRAETANLQKQSADLGKHVAPLRNIATDLRKLIAKDRTEALSSNERQIIEKAANDLDGGVRANYRGGVAGAFFEPGAAAMAPQLSESLAKLIKPISAITAASDKISDATKDIWGELQRLQKQLADILKELQPVAAEPPTLTLYEVTVEGGRTQLKLVPLP